jgi:hypothetical protein
MSSRKLLLGLAALSALALACGSAGEVTAGGGNGAAAAEAKDAAPIAVKIGQKLTVDSGGLHATYTLSKPEIRAEGEFGSEPENGAYLVAFLRVDVAKGETFACSCELSLVQKDGKVREQTYASFDDRPEFESADLKAGQHSDGWVVWDLPKKSINGSKVQLKISSLFADSEYGYWTVQT